MKAIMLLPLLNLFWVWAGEEESKKDWSNKTELSVVATGGNAEAETLGFSNDFMKKLAGGELVVKFGGIRAESTTSTRSATGTPDQFTVIEEKTTKLTAERFYLSLKYDRKISDRFFWFTGGDWERNEFAGIENRYWGSAGLGNVWLDGKQATFKTDYGLQYTVEELVGNVDDDSYVAARFSYLFTRKIGKSSEFKQTLNGVNNLEESGDFRLDLDNELTVSMSTHLALKVGLRLLYDNEPPFESIPLEGMNTTVRHQFDELDTIFLTSLVVNY